MQRLKEAEVEEDAKYEIDHYVVIDFEATCEKDSPPGFIHEIIEFPAVLINVKRREIVSMMLHYYCQIFIQDKLLSCKIHTFFYKNTLIFAEPQYSKDIFKSEPYFILKLFKTYRHCHTTLSGHILFRIFFWHEINSSLGTILNFQQIGASVFL